MKHREVADFDADTRANVCGRYDSAQARKRIELSKAAGSQDL